jgi:hypothetical protein
MRITPLLKTCIPSVFVVMSCHVNPIEEIPTDVRIVSFIADAIIDDDGTKSSFNDSNGNFYWEQDDTVGIFPDVGSQIYFEMNSGAGTSSATFTGGGWDLKTSSSYYSYYPFIGNIYLNRNKIPVSYLGQKQLEPNATNHVGPVDFMYADSEMDANTGSVNFHYHHLSTFIRLLLTLPAGTYTKLALTSPDADFMTEGFYDLLASTPKLTGTKFSKQLVLDFEPITLTTTSTFTVYLAAAPVNLSGKELTVSVLNAERKEYQCKKTPSAEYLAGHRRGLTCSSFTEVPQTMGLIIDDWDDGGNIGGDAE